MCLKGLSQPVDWYCNNHHKFTNHVWKCFHLLWKWIVKLYWMHEKRMWGASVLTWGHWVYGWAKQAATVLLLSVLCTGMLDSSLNLTCMSLSVWFWWNSKIRDDNIQIKGLGLRQFCLSYIPWGKIITITILLSQLIILSCLFYLHSREEKHKTFVF